ncbi:ABC transporter ATP-binding protein [Natronorarus salvus]|uniref:ABC transporter ATP-binding protein n=1 Tax=Natronorarus salvus TaxID=3117733 RepID=UPI002F26DD20
MTAIELENVTTGYGDNEILHELSMAIEEDRVSTIIGPNGSGKSTTLKAISGLVPVWEGDIFIRGDRITDASTKEIVEKGVVMLPQGGNVFTEMTVKENLKIGAYLNDDKEELKRRYEGVYDVFPILEERNDQRAGDLSGGQQMMVAIGRSLMADPKVLLLDEPSAGLAPNLTDQVFDQIQRLKESGIDMVIVEQNVRKVLDIAEYVFVLDQGEVAYRGPKEGFEDSEELMGMYFGKH